MPHLCRSMCALALSCCLITVALCRQLQLSDLGCFIDLATERDVAHLKHIGLTRIGDTSFTQYNTVTDNGTIKSPAHMTHELCASVCALGGFRYMGLQAREWCFCGNSYGSHGAAPDSECDRNCAGNLSQNCGGIYRNRVFRLDYASNSLLVLGNRTFAGLTDSADVAVSTVTAPCLGECGYRCIVLGRVCQAVVFNGQQRLCHLLEFAVVPSILGSSGDFFVRG